MQQDSPCQDYPESYHTLDDSRYDMNVSQSSANASNEVLVDANEFIPSLPEMDPMDWHELLQEPGDIATQNEGPANGVSSGSGLFMSSFDSLDNPQYTEQSMSYLSSLNPGSNTGCSIGFGFDNSMDTFSQTSAYHPGAAPIVASDMEPTGTVGSMMAGTTEWMQNTAVYESKTMKLVDVGVGECQMASAQLNLHLVLIKAEDEKRKRKTRSDKGIKRGPNRAKGMTAKNRDTAHADEDSGKEADQRKRTLEEDGEDADDEREVPQKQARHDGDDLEHSVPDESDEKNVASARPKGYRKKGNPNVEYRHSLRLKKQEEEENERNPDGGILPTASYSEGVSKLFRSVRSIIPPRKIYPRKKNPSNDAAAPPSDQATPIQESNDAISSSDQVPKTSQARARREKTNPRPHISKETVRSTAPEGWDPYDNPFYSGDDNISDDDIEDRGKASAYKPPRMACRRCNKFKQPCDHDYPSCSLCAKNNQRCRYRDDLTGRQIRPGQLEEVEAAYHDSLRRIQRLEETVRSQEKLLEEARQRSNAWQATASNIMDRRDVPGGSVCPEGLLSAEEFVEQ